MSQDMEALFSPKSVAIVGASRDDRKLANNYLRAFLTLGYEGKIYPINPTAAEIHGLKTYPNLISIPDEIDQVIIAIQAPGVPAIIEECGEKGVKFAVIHTAGFAEVDDEGKALQKKVVEIAKRKNVRLIGPNCQGAYCPEAKFAFFANMTFEPGDVAYVSQSGSLTNGFATRCAERGLGLSKAVSTGNECDLTGIDFLEYYGMDPDTKLIAAYLEGVKDGPRFMALAKKISLEKPILIWKAGRTEAGKRAATSHTGSLAGEDLIYSAAFRQAGITKATGMIDLVDATAAFHALVRYPIGPRVAIITAPGGPGIATTDACEEAGLTIPPLEAEIRKALMGVMPSFGSPVNPVDLTLQASTIPGLIPNAVKIVSTSKAIDMILLISQINDERAKEFLELAPQIEKPLVIVGSGIEGIPEASKPLLKAGIPSYPTPDRAAQALAKVVQYKAWVTQNES